MTPTRPNEMALLGIILAGNGESAIEEAISAGITSDHFTEQDTRDTWAVCCSLFSKNQPVSILTVSDKSADIDFGFMEDCIDSEPVNANAAYHIERIQLAYLLRSAQVASEAVQKMLSSSTIDTARETVAKAQDRLCSVEIRERDTREPADIAIQHIDEWLTTDIDHRKGVPWFLEKLNHNLGHITDELIYLAAAPSVGKTAFALNLCVCAAWAGIRTSFASLEMGKERVSDRLISIVSGENAHSLKFKRVLEDRYAIAKTKMQKFRDKAARYIGWNFEARTIEQLAAWGKAQGSAGSRLLVIDNTRHIHGHGKGRSMVEDMSKLSIRLKALRDDLHYAVMVLHHLREDTMNLQWSTDIRNDADIIAYLVNDDEDTHKDEMAQTFQIVKNRDAPTMKEPLVFVKPEQRFEEK